jgi:YVTN family beta-propeller protein
VRQGAFPRFHPRTRVGVVLAVAALLAVVPAAVAAGRTILATATQMGIVAIDSQTGNPIGGAIATGLAAVDLAITPDGRFAYVSDTHPSGNVFVVDVRAHQLVGGPIAVGLKPRAIAISADGRRAYVVNGGANSVSVIDTTTNRVEGAPIAVGPGPEGIAVTADGKRAFVGNRGADTVSVLDLEARKEVGVPIPVGDEPEGMAITPDGKSLYVVNHADDTVSVIDVQKGEVTTTVKLRSGTQPVAVAFTPDGTVAYLSGRQFGEVVVIDTRANQILTTLDIGGAPSELAMSPDGKSVLAADLEERGLTRIDTATNTIVGSPLPIGAEGGAAAFVPDQGPLARFTATRARPGVPAKLDASSSTDPDGKVARYAWTFDDGGKATATRPRESHVFRRPGTYTVSLQVTDDEGCSTAFVYTGRIALCNGSNAALTQKTITVAFPGVRVSCPRSAGRRGCSIRLQAVTSKRRPKPQSGVASVKLKAGKAKIVSLRPTPRFSGRLATARKILVKRTIRTASGTRTQFARLKVVQ